MSDQKQIKLERLALLEKKERIREGLPFLHGWKWYKWAREFFESTNKFNFLVAANQISKSSTQIRKCIDWATNQNKWTLLWRSKPTQFWYLYPSKDVATIEFETKWVPEFLPRNEFKEHPVYGWRAEYKSKQIYAIYFNSGVTIYFKTYEQDVQNLQTGTCYAIFGDEEIPENIYQELRARLSATHGYFHLVFTATLGQDIWRRTMEPNSKDEELFVGAWKKQISMYDCLEYDDGEKSFWTEERIKQIEGECGTQAEIQRRVYGRFVVSSGIKFAGFDMKRNIKPKHPTPSTWHHYSGVDVGSGGEKGHPAAMVIVAVSPDFKKGRVVRGWRGDKITTTASDILTKHCELKTYLTSSGAPKQLAMTAQFYDWQAKDFFTISSRAGETFTPADKDRQRGEQILNTLFSSGMLCIQDGDSELQKLIIELTTLLHTTPKTSAKDDFVDALRYAVTQIPWDWTAATGDLLEPESKLVDTRSESQRNIDERREHFEGKEDRDWSIEEELEAWDELYSTETGSDIG